MKKKKGVKISFTQKRYFDLRKKLLKEERDLMYERDKINRKLREIRTTLYQWDTALLRT